MSSEQQERMAVQYAERSLLFTVKSLLKILEWSRRQALAQDSAYKIGVQKLEELLQSPYSIDTINLKKDFLDKPIDIEKFKAFFRKRRDSFSHRLARGFSAFLHERPFDSRQSFRPSVRKNG